MSDGRLFSRYFDEIEVGESYTTRGRTITEADIVNFSALTGDWHELHTNVEFAAKNSIFGERIAHGMLVLSYAFGLMPLEESPIVAFYGFDKLRFTAPTKIGDTITVKLELVEKEVKSEDFGLATISMEVINQRDEAAAKATMKVLLHREAH